MSFVKPSQLPPTKTAATLDTMPNNLSASDLVMVTNGSSKSDSQPSEEPPTDLQVNMAWQNNKKFTALWSINENRNAWVYVEGIGWKKFLIRNLKEHKQPGYAAISISLKRSGVAPGDANSDEMRHIANLADQYSFGELRVTHEQNFVFSDVPKNQLFNLWQQLKTHNLAMPNIGLVSDIIACPGGDFCSLANAKSIPIAQAITELVDDIDYQFDLGDISVNISGCINSCGHHHIGNIGILGVDKKGEEWYQITLGGQQGNQAAIGKVIGPSFGEAEVPSVVKKVLDVYVEQRHDDELFIETFERIGLDPFKLRIYGQEAA